jgi:hypothetical protein
MGSWGAGPFDNDAATDWYLELIETGDLSLIEEVLEADVVNDRLFDISDLDLIAAACEVALGLLAPDDFAKPGRMGPGHGDPLRHGLQAVVDHQNKSSGVAFAIPSEVANWVMHHRHLDPRRSLSAASTILDHAKAKGEALYRGYFRDEEAKAARLSYMADLHARVAKAVHG